MRVRFESTPTPNALCIRGTGQSVCAFAKLAGAREVIAVDHHDHRLKFAQRMGATRTLSLKMSSAERKQLVHDAEWAAGHGARGARGVVR